MGWLLSDGTAVVGIVLVVLLVLSPGLRRRARSRVRGCRLGALRVGRRLGIVPTPVQRPEHRPIEVVAHEARRLRSRYYATRTGVSFAKSEAVRRAYDDVLAEGCEALGLPHLLGVLDNVELDLERQRVERLLHVWGIDLEMPPEAA